MGWVTDLAKEIPMVPILKERLTQIEADFTKTKEELEVCQKRLAELEFNAAARTRWVKVLEQFYKDYTLTKNMNINQPADTVNKEKFNTLLHAAKRTYPDDFLLGMIKEADEKTKAPELHSLIGQLKTSLEG